MSSNAERCPECGKLMLRISWSALRTHLECKQRGALMRAGKRLNISDSRSFFPGNVVDRVVRDWLAGEPEKNFGKMPDLVDFTIERELGRIKERGGLMKWKHDKDQELVSADCKEAVEKIEPILIAEVLPNEWEVDFRFQAPLGIPDIDDSIAYITLSGAMDILVRTPEGKFRVWDVKMTRDNSYWKKTVGQLSFYDLAVFALFEQDTDAVGLFQPMCTEEVLRYDLDDSKRSVIMQQVIGMAHDIWLGDDTPTMDMSRCSFCDTKHACTRFAPTRVGGRKVVSLL